MPSGFTHAAAALAIGTCFRPALPRGAWMAGAVCATLPDIDALGYWAGVPYQSFLGHRGFSHSLVAAALLAGAVTAALAPRAAEQLTAARLFAFLLLVTASHGILDAFTDGGGGIALLAPFDNTRYFAPFRPIRVAPISISRFFTARGASVFISELLWVWLPFGALAWARWSRTRGRPVQSGPA